MAEKFTVPPILKDERFFKIVSSEDCGSVIAECLTCSKNGNQKTISGKYQPSSNFVTHLKRKHPEEFSSYEAREKVHSASGSGRGKQMKLDFPKTGESYLKTKVETLIVDFVVQTMSPLSIVEDKAFLNLVKGLNPQARVMTRKTLSGKIMERFAADSVKLKKRLNDVKFVCVTADLWSSSHRSFLGVTCHWIENFKRMSAILALKRFKGRHNFDKVAESLVSIFNSFDLDNEKIVSVVTDNGSNFVKAFKEYGIDFQEWPEECLEGDDDGDVLEACDWGETSNEEILLPPHIRCASHTLSLVATKDSVNVAQTDSKDSVASYKRIFSSAMAKCSSIWNRLSRSQQTKEKIIEKCGKALSRPVPTRWNSLYDAIARLLEYKAILTEICNITEVAAFTSSEIEFLEEYYAAMKPVVRSMESTSPIFV